jgi:uncharacterized DUF497 family protein
MKFEWDETKEKLNIQKHNVTFEQASYVFSDQFALIDLMMNTQKMKIDGFYWVNHSMKHYY